MAIKIEMLRAFAAVAEGGSLAKAAERLGRTPSAVSMMVKQLEDHLGVPLFESGRKSRLSAMGRFAFEEARGMLEGFERGVGALEDFARSKAGFVRLAAVPSVAEVILPSVVSRFLEDHPEVRIDIRDMDSASVHRELTRGRIDLGLASGGAPDGRIRATALLSDAFGVVCPKGHPLTEKTAPLRWSALAPYPFIANGLCSQIDDEDFQNVLSGSALMVRNTSSLLAMVRAGIGITVLTPTDRSGGRQDHALLRPCRSSGPTAYRPDAAHPALAGSGSEVFRGPLA